MSSPIGGLRHHRTIPTTAAAGVARRFDRLAVPAALRFRIRCRSLARRGRRPRARADRARPEPWTQNFHDGYPRRKTGILETQFETAEDAFTLIDCLGRCPDTRKPRSTCPPGPSDQGRVAGCTTELTFHGRFDYGAAAIPWVRQAFRRPRMPSRAPNALQFITPVELRGTRS